jgi:hypothetical protein
MTHDTNTGTSAHDLASAGRSALADGVQTVRTTGAGIRHAAAVALDAQRGPVATRLGDVAHVLHGGANAMAAMAADAGQVAHGVADTVDDAARYVRNREARDMSADVGTLARVHLGKTLLGALAVGYLAGRVLHRAPRGLVTATTSA